jgi:hypothetical protein
MRDEILVTEWRLTELVAGAIIFLQSLNGRRILHDLGDREILTCVILNTHIRWMLCVVRQVPIRLHVGPVGAHHQGATQA